VIAAEPFPACEAVRHWRHLALVREVAMHEDHGPTEQFTDEEAAFLRHARFGELPPRVLPSEMVQLVETESRRDIPEPAGDRHNWDVRGASGA